VQLFAERARARRPGFEPTEAEVAAIAQICGHLDGIPLAIELAAALLPEYSVEQIAARLDDRFGLLTRGSRVLRPRHQTLRAAMDWSYALLRVPEQAALRRLSVCAGGWYLDAAEAVCPGDGMVRETVAPLLARLVAKSLVVADGRGAANEPERYRMLETVRQYARDMLSADEAAYAQDRHWDWCLDLAERALEAFTGPEQGRWLDRLELEHDNLRAALSWSAAAGTREGLRLAAALWRLWYVRGHLSEGRHWLDLFLERPPAELQAGTGPPDAETPRDSPRARALTGAGNLAFLQGDLVRAEALLRECLDLYRGYGNALGTAGALHNLANVLYRQGDLDQAVALLEEALSLQRQSDRKDLLAAFLNSLGNALMHQGHYQRAAALFDESLALCRELGHTWGCVMTQRNLGLVARFQGDFEAAATLFEESLALSQQLGSVHDTAVAINDLGQVACEQGACEQALALHEESLALARELDDQWNIAAAIYGLGQVALKQGRYRKAAALFGESLASWHRQGGKEGVIQCLEGLARAQMQDGHGAPVYAACAYAARLCGAAEAMRMSTSMPLPPAAELACRQIVMEIRTRLGPEASATLWDVGAAMSLDEAVSCALTDATAFDPYS
jgi:tetratricopeptide (TPR) repeat protein